MEFRVGLLSARPDGRYKVVVVLAFAMFNFFFVGPQAARRLKTRPPSDPKFALGQKKIWVCPSRQLGRVGLSFFGQVRVGLLCQVAQMMRYNENRCSGGLVWFLFVLSFYSFFFSIPTRTTPTILGFKWLQCCIWWSATRWGFKLNSVFKFPINISCSSYRSVPYLFAFRPELIFTTNAYLCIILPAQICLLFFPVPLSFFPEPFKSHPVD